MAFYCERRRAILSANTSDQSGEQHLQRPARQPLQAMWQGWNALDRVQRGLLVLMLARVALALVFILNLLPLELRDPQYRWYLQHGGDQEQMMELAQSILSGRPRESVVGLGQALVMIPWIALLNPQRYIEIAAPLVLINGFLLGGLSVLLVGGIARLLTGSRAVTLGSAALWAFLPLLAYVGFFWHPEAVLLRSATVPKVAWLNGLSDGPAVFFLMLALYLLARALDLESDRRFWHLTAAGAALGMAVTFRIHTASMVLFLALVVLVAYGWRAALALGGGAMLSYLPQAWYNLTVFGLPVTTGYISYGDFKEWGGTTSRPLRDILTNLPFHPRNIVETLVYFIGRRPWLIAPLLVGVGIISGVVVIMWRRRGWQTVALLIGAPLAYLAPMLTAFNFREDVIRFLLPAAPMLLIVGVYMLAWLWARVTGQTAVLRSEQEVGR